MEDCKCDSGKSFSNCCGPFLAGERFPATAEELMRSRYSAYSIGNVDYVLATHDPEDRNSLDPKATGAWAEKATFTGLTVIQTEGGARSDSKGIVEFLASYEMDGESYEHHEVARFRRVPDEDNHWFYVDGEFPNKEPVVRANPKIGRNDPCHCGSGKKFKKCCG